MEPGLAAAEGKEQTGNLQMGVTSDESLEAVTVMTAANLKKSLFLTGVLKAGLRPASGREAGVMDPTTPSTPGRPPASWMRWTAVRDSYLTLASSVLLVISKTSWWQCLLVTEALCCTYVRAELPRGDPRTKPA